MTTTETEITDQWCCETCRRLSAANIDGRGHVLSRDALDLAEEAGRLRTERDQFRDSALMYAARVAELNDEIVKLRADRDKLAATIAAYLETDERGIHHAANTAHARAQRDAALAELAAQREESTR